MPILLGITSRPSLTRRLTIPVDLPEIQVLHTVSLSVLVGTEGSASESCALEGEPVPAELTIEHTRQWGQGKIEPEQLEFYYDLRAKLDDWLVGGQRSGYFTVKVRTNFSSLHRCADV